MWEHLQLSFLGTEYANAPKTLGIILASIVVSIILRRILRNYVSGWVENTKTQIDDLVVERVLTPLTYGVILVGIAVGTSYLKLPAETDYWLSKILLALGLLIFFMIVIRLAQGGIEMAADAYIQKLQAEQPENLDQQITYVERIKKQAREITNMVLVVLAVLTILSNLGFDLKAIWASLGIGTIAIALAVQEPLKNLVGRMYIYSTGIFDEGHFIEFDQWSGTVLKITAFRTYIEVFSDGTTVSVPNEHFIKGVVKSYFGRTKYIFKWDLDVPYDTSPETIQQLLERLKELILSKSEADSTGCWIYLDRLGSSSKVVRVWFRAFLPSWAESLTYGNGILHEIQLVFRDVGVEFAFPTQTIHIAQDNDDAAEKEEQGQETSS